MSTAIDLLNKITKKKRSQVEVLDYLLKHDPKLHYRVKSCASFLLLREWIESGETKILNANFCKRHQICPSCAVRRGARMAEAALDRILYLMALDSNLKALHVTLTLPNTKSLEEGLMDLKTAWSLMIAHRRKALSKSGRHQKIEWCKVQGGIRSVEVTNKGKGWHPHMHCLVLVEEYLDLKKLSKEFQSFGGGKIVWANKIGSTEQELVPALLEVLKYPTKFSELSPKQRLEFYNVSRKTRLTDSFGILRGIKLGDIDQDDMEGFTGAYRDWIARWYHRKQGYSLYPADTWGDSQD